MPPAGRDAIVGELRARAIPFRTVTAGAGLDDLAALDRIIGDARIVALGEATHGTAEFFRMKHRLFEYLVERKGFTVLAFEANWPAVEVADRYIKTGEGSAAAALREMGFWFWQTQEVADLIEWMRAYNSAPGGRKRLSFTGFDMEDGAAAATCVIDIFTRFGLPEAEVIRRHYAGTKEMARLLGPADPGDARWQGEKAKLQTDVAEALRLIDARRATLLNSLAPEAYRRARQCAAIVVQASFPDAASEDDIRNARDRAMAQNVRWLVEEAFPGEKIVLWAHNAHIATASHMALLPTTMGQHLRRAFGDQMRVLGFAFDRGEFRSVPLRRDGRAPGAPIPIRVPPSRPNRAEALLRLTGLPRFILDLRAVPAASALGRWLAEPQTMRAMGGAYVAADDVTAYGTSVLPEAFDALVFIEESSASVPLS